MVEIRAIKGTTSEQVVKEVNKGLNKLGFDAYVEKLNPTAVKVSDVRLGEKHIAEHGFNISPYTGRRGRILGWNDWVKFNNMINQALDRLNASASASSNRGLFKIRKGTQAFKEEDWEEQGERNVGSMINPVRLRDAWMSEERPRAKKELKKIIW